MGIGDMPERGALPEAASAIGTDLGALLPEAAETLGLTTACRVGAGLIDAHAGALGVLGSIAREGDSALDRHIALIAGTSSCNMALSPEPRFVPGVWGPYLGAVLPGWWLNEGGQSATGALLDHVLRLHSAGGEPTSALHARVVERIGELRASEGSDFAAGLHVLPDFHGNRSPLADPHATGVISGLTLDSGFDSLCRLYYRTAVGIALGVRHIIDALNAKGYRIDTLHLTGGHVKNPLLVGALRRRDPLPGRPAGDRGRGPARHGHGGGGRGRPLPEPARRSGRDGAGGGGADARPGGSRALRPRLPRLPAHARAAPGAGDDRAGVTRPLSGAARRRRRGRRWRGRGSRSGRRGR